MFFGLARMMTPPVVARLPGPMPSARTAAVYLLWIPLGAGGHSVRFNGRVYEAVKAVLGRRRPRDLYHSALVVQLDGHRYTIEVAPSPDADEASRGVVAMGAVGSRWIGWLRLFRYEVRCWRDGSIPDLVEAVGEPLRLTTDRRVVSSSSWRGSRRRCGDATSCTQARCGTRTP